MRRLRHRLYFALGRFGLVGRLAARVRKEAGLLVGAYFAEGWSQQGQRRILGHVGPSVRVFVDVGANVGNWTRQMLASAPPGVGGLLVEPGKAAMERLRAEFGHDPLLVLVEAGASDAEGESVFYEEEGAGEWSSFVPTHVSPASSARAVPVCTIDALAGRHGLSHIDYLKIDAEGYDLRVLRGARGMLRAQAITYVQFEYNTPWAGAGSTLSAALSLLADNGYTTYLIRADGLYELPYERFGEFFAYANFLAVAPSAATHIQPLLRGRLA